MPRTHDAPFLASVSIHQRDRHADESDPVALWQLRRAGDDLLCATVLTTYGYAIALALSGELVITEPQCQSLGPFT